MWNSMGKPNQTTMMQQHQQMQQPLIPHQQMQPIQPSMQPMQQEMMQPQNIQQNMQQPMMRPMMQPSMMSQQQQQQQQQGSFPGAFPTAQVMTGMGGMVAASNVATITPNIIRNDISAANDTITVQNVAGSSAVSKSLGSFWSNATKAASSALNQIMSFQPPPQQQQQQQQQVVPGSNIQNQQSNIRPDHAGGMRPQGAMLPPTPNIQQQQQQPLHSQYHRQQPPIPGPPYSGPPIHGHHQNPPFKSHNLPSPPVNQRPLHRHNLPNPPTQHRPPSPIDHEYTGAFSDNGIPDRTGSYFRGS